MVTSNKARDGVCISTPTEIPVTLKAALTAAVHCRSCHRVSLRRVYTVRTFVPIIRRSYSDLRNGLAQVGLKHSRSNAAPTAIQSLVVTTNSPSLLSADRWICIPVLYTYFEYPATKRTTTRTFRSAPSYRLRVSCSTSS